MKYLPGRRAYLSASLKLAALVAVPAALLRSASAQGPLVPDPEVIRLGLEVEALKVRTNEIERLLRDEINALRPQIDALDAESSEQRARINALDDRVDVLESNPAPSEPAPSNPATSDPAKFRAPFTVTDDNGNPILIVTAENSGGQLVLISSVNSRCVLLEAVESGGSLTLADDAGVARIHADAKAKGSQIVFDNDSAKITLGANDGGSENGIRVEKGGKAVVSLIAGAAGTSLRMADGRGVNRVQVLADGRSAPLTLFDGQSEQIFSVRFDGDNPLLLVGKEAGPCIQTGVLSDGSGAFFQCLDKSTTERLMISASEQSTHLSMNDAKMTADLGSDLKSDKAGLFLSKDDLNFASIRFDKSGGSVRIGDAKGVGVVAIDANSDDNGGHISVTGPGGGAPVARLWGSGEGGNLGLYEAGGKMRAYLNASQTGDLNLYGDGGAFTASSGDSAPTMQISDAGGTVLVEAYVTKAGLGALAVGPAGNGVAGTMGMGMQAASALLGKK